MVRNNALWFSSQSTVKYLSETCYNSTGRMIFMFILPFPFQSHFCILQNNKRNLLNATKCYYTPDACFQHERFLQYAECAYEPRKCFALQCKHAEYIFHDYFLAKLKFTIWLSCENLLSVIKLYCCNRFVFLYDFILDQASLARASRAWERLSINIMGFCY